MHSGPSQAHMQYDADHSYRDSVRNFLFSPPGCWKQAQWAIFSASVSYLFIYFDDSCQTNYLKIYQTDLRQIFRVYRTVAVYDQSIWN